MKPNQVVERILRDEPATRNNDKLLLLRTLETYGLWLTPEQQHKYFDAPSAETITRVRRSLQSEGKYMATEPVRKQRRLKSLIIQQNTPLAGTPRLSEFLQRKLF